MSSAISKVLLMIELLFPGMHSYVKSYGLGFSCFAVLLRYHLAHAGPCPYPERRTMPH